MESFEYFIQICWFLSIYSMCILRRPPPVIFYIVSIVYLIRHNIPTFRMRYTNVIFKFSIFIGQYCRFRSIYWPSILVRNSKQWKQTTPHRYIYYFRRKSCKSNRCVLDGCSSFAVITWSWWSDRPKAKILVIFMLLALDKRLLCMYRGI